VPVSYNDRCAIYIKTTLVKLPGFMTYTIVARTLLNLTTIIAFCTLLTYPNDAFSDIYQKLANLDQYKPKCSPSTKAPEITILSTKLANGFYSDRFKILGRIRSNCVQEAGVYVDNQLISSINQQQNGAITDEIDFRLIIDASEEPEIRVTDTNQRETVLKIDVLDYRG
jgi:hypothetical protein